LFVETGLERMVAAVVAGLGYEFVKLQANGRMLRVFIDHAKGVNVEDCARVSEHLTRLFEVERVDFSRLEVSSPGLDRELVKPADFTRFAGRQVKLKLKAPVDGRRHFAGTLRGLKEGAIELDQESGRVSILLDDVAKARLVPQALEALRRKE
jgi:ribosome maturation factor RimP